MDPLSDFEPLGITGRAIPSDWVNKFKGQKALVVATAKCVWSDLGSVGITQFNRDGIYHGWHVVAINDMIVHWPGVINHAYSNQHRWLEYWCGARRETIGGIKTRDRWGHVPVTHSCGTGGKVTWPWPGNGTSTLNAVYTALALGYDPVVVCGAPLDNSPHYFEPDWIQCNFHREVGINVKGQLMYWQRARDRIFKGRVFSQSGRTMELLGAFS